MTAKIKPCPFCGAQLSVSNIQLDNRVCDGKRLHDDWSAVYMSCPSCNAGMGIEEELLPKAFTACVIEKWNRRPDTEESANLQHTTDK